MRVILCGYNWAGCKALDLLIKQNHEIYVYTNLSPYYTNSLVDYCKKNEVKFTTEKISINNLPFIPDIICSIYYRFIIDIKVIELVKGKIFNLHPSLLPQYRGCSSLNWALINGEKIVGFTYHYITNQIDKGHILIQKEIELEDFDTGISIYYRVMFEALKDFSKVLNLVFEGFKGTPQTEGGEYFKRGAPYDCIIDSSWSIDKVERFIRAMNYPPLPPAQYNGIDIRVIDDYLKLA